MKKAGIFAAASVATASVSAASYVALSSGSDRCAGPHFKNEGSSLPSGSKEAGSESRRDGGVDKFAPRFDGLRFIETLVTAHR
ncbi:uncharacterized protein LOC110099144 [Dendrobium catenatum]|uniref:uncharacterized protein LOC110099144 n=1 Tax=Dendrobium catenatum TaxID=906689 RepID=UPI0009F214F8|nr:uncharacterized protein LOC110099144 [Dendrobium catenatum]